MNDVNRICPVAATCRIKGCSMCVSSRGEMLSECEHYHEACRKLDNARFVGFLMGAALILFIQFAVATAIRMNNGTDAAAGAPPCETRSGD